MSSLLRKLLVQGENGPEEAVIDGKLVKADNGQTFASHVADATQHLPAAADAGRLLASRVGAAPEWIEKADLLTDAALTGTPTAPTAPAGTDTDQIASTAFVAASVTAAEQKLAQQMSNGMRIKGNIGTTESGEGNVTELPSSNVSVGDSYYVTVAGTYGTHECEVGDTIICRNIGDDGSNPEWFVLQKNLINAVTGPKTSVDGNLVSYDGTTGTAVKDSGISSADVSDAVSKKHSHSNSATLDKFGEGADGALTYDGKPIGACRIAASVEEASAANAPAGTLFFVIENVA